MEFVGNRIHGVGIATVLLTAFFIGRINLFHGTFPAAVASITVMLAVSTVYIYLVPVMAAAMALYGGQGVFFYGDLLSLVFLGLFFLFFHRHKFSINQRTAIAVTATIVFHCVAYAAADMLFLLRVETLLKEAVALLIYIRVLNILAKVVYMGKQVKYISGEKVTLAMEIFVISMVGSIGIGQIVFPIWVFLGAVIAYSKGVQAALSFISLAAVYWLCQGETQWDIFICLFAGIIAGWYGVGLIDERYKKAVVAISVFAAVGFMGGSQIYGVAGAMALFILLPSSFLTKASCLIEERFMPEIATDKDLQYLAIGNDLHKKKEAFLSLGKLYGAGMEGKQIISYQFMGMARAIDKVMEDLRGRGESSNPFTPMTISVGQASYSFESVSGDSMTAFAYDKHNVALMISDGMGKGSKAAEESKMVVTTLSRLLQAGFDVDLAMKTINGILMTGNQDERFATVDLAIIDRKKGRVKIYKMGAATTFMKHNGRVSMLKRQALPAGITQGMELEYIDIKLRKGDILVMVSDGVTDCDRKDPNCQWLRDRLLEIGSRDPETIAELLVNKAVEKYGIHERDDLTVIVAAIDV